MQSEFLIRTSGPGLVEFTGEVEQFVHTAGGTAGVADGLLTLFVRHTSCSLLIQENADPDVRRDLDEFLVRLVPYADDETMSWLRHVQEGPDDMPAHIKSALLPVSLSIPVSGGRMALGTWQGIYLFEHRFGSHTRHVIAHFQG